MQGGNRRGRTESLSNFSNNSALTIPSYIKISTDHVRILRQEHKDAKAVILFLLILTCKT